MRLAAPFGEALANLRRSPGPTVVAIGTIAASLFLLGGYALGLQNLAQLVRGVRGQVVIAVYLADDADIALLSASAGNLPGVRSVRVVTKQQALKRLESSVARMDGLIDAVGGNPLPASLEIVPASTDEAAVEGLTKILAGLPGVDEVEHGRDWMERLGALVQFLAYAGLVVGLAVLLVAAFVVASALRAAVQSRRDEIEVLKLVGATDGYVRAPFLIEGGLEGLVGAGTALAALLAVHGLAAPRARELLLLAFGHAETAFLAPSILFGLLAAGVLLGVVGSALAVQSLLKKVT